MKPSWSPAATRGLNVVLAVASAAAVVGFFTGTAHVPAPSGYREAKPSAYVLGRAPKQRDMEEARFAHRRAQQQAALEGMRHAPRGLEDTVAVDPANYAKEVAARAVGRAYDGAPPTIPHQVDQLGAPACLSCHEHGMQVEGKVARVMSHQAYASCLQCHATRENALPAPLLPHTVSELSTFQGLASPGHGPRAWSIAPPQIPHRTFMRERCVSCHGPWSQGISSSHPARQSCTQCHTPAASSDQQPHSSLAPLGWPEGVGP